jgi:uncharacterized protein YecT (DUF1311 family)
MRSFVRCYSFAFAAILLVASARAQSFDCRYARSPDEIAVCEYPGLSRLDERLGTLYVRVRDNLAPNDRAALENTQRTWLFARRSCGADRTCLRRTYWNRIRDLRRQLVQGRAGEEPRSPGIEAGPTAPAGVTGNPLLQSGSPAANCPRIVRGKGYLSGDARYRLTRNVYQPSDDLDQEIKSRYGGAAQIADWADLKKILIDEHSVRKFIDGVGIPLQSTDYDCDNILVTYQGRASVNGYHYLMARHDGVKPAGWAILDTIGHDDIHLGRWNHSGEVLIKIPVGDQMQPTTAPSAVNEPGPSPSTAATSAPSPLSAAAEHQASNLRQAGKPTFKVKVVQSYECSEPPCFKEVEITNSSKGLSPCVRGYKM